MAKIVCINIAENEQIDEMFDFLNYIEIKKRADIKVSFSK